LVREDVGQHNAFEKLDGTPCCESIDLIDDIIHWGMNDQLLSVGHGARPSTADRAATWLQASEICHVCRTGCRPWQIGAGNSGYREDSAECQWYAGIQCVAGHATHGHKARFQTSRLLGNRCFDAVIACQLCSIDLACGVTQPPARRDRRLRGLRRQTRMVYKLTLAGSR
jgi:hypothetical protein